MSTFFIFFHPWNNLDGIEWVGLQKSLAIRGKEKRQWRWEQDDLNIVAVRANEDDGDLNVVTNFLLVERSHEGGGSFCCPLPRIPVLTSHNAEGTRNGTALASKVHTLLTPDKSAVCVRGICYPKWKNKLEFRVISCVIRP